MLSTKKFVTGALVLGLGSAIALGSLLAPKAQAGDCDQDITVRIAPYASRFLIFCSVGDPILNADSASGGDVDALIYDDEGDLVAADTAYDGYPRVRADAYGWNVWHGEIRNCTSRWQTVTVRTR